MAFGAASRDVLGLVFRQGMRVRAAGSRPRPPRRVRREPLPGEHPLRGSLPGDPVSYLLAFGVVVGTAVLACLAPAFRATRTQPTVALRHG